MISFNRSENTLLLEYTPEFDNPQWVLKKFQNDEAVCIKRTFRFTQAHLYYPDLNENNLKDADWFPAGIEFILGSLEDGYYKIDGDILNVDFTLFVDADLAINEKFFVASRNIAVWPKLAKLKPPKEVFIGGNKENAIPSVVFKKLCKKFPSSSELDKYAAARISAILRDDLDLEVDAESLYEKYMGRKTTISSDKDIEELNEFEFAKYKLLHNKLAKMLKDERGYSEKQWQSKILDILCLLFPKYIYVLRESKIIDKIFNTTRFADFLLVDFYGNIDIAEIKKPNDKNIVSTIKYRDNHVPYRELSGTIMQVEKYIYHLNRSADKGEKEMMNQYKDDLPEGLQIKITNPKGIIIMGRDKDLNNDQRIDFEIIKRKYNNVVDILTYDDLLRRLKFLITHLKSEEKATLTNR